MERSATRPEQAAAQGTHAAWAGMTLPSTKGEAALTERVKLRSMSVKEEEAAAAASSIPDVARRWLLALAQRAGGQDA